MNESVKNCYEAILEAVKWELEEMISDKETHNVDFADLIFENVDTEVSTMSREECIRLIDATGNEQYIDQGIIDTSSLDRMLVTTAFGCLEQEMYNDSLIQTISNELETMTEMDEVKSLLKEVNDELECLQ